MTDPTWERVKAILGDAAELPAGQRTAFVEEACTGSGELRAKVEALLAAHEEAGEFLSEPTQDDRALNSDTWTFNTQAVATKIGTRIGRYKLLELIGEGGFGLVYMAEQQEPVRRKVALKIIKLGMDTKQVIARFEAERQALAMMDHPNIAKVLDAGATEGGRPYFVMDLVRGVPITEYCDQNRLSTRERLELFIQVCRAIQHAHQKGIIHRDIKPNNVLVTLRDVTPVPKIIDFGIAKATQQRLTEKTLFTEFKQFVGTPAYMSPEQAQMSELDVDTRTDIYSLGVLLYELLTGTPPFDQKMLREAAFSDMQRIITEVDPPRPSTRLSTLSDQLSEVARRRHTEPDVLGKLIRGDVDWIVMRALEKDRTRRYETANDLARDIERHLHHEPVLAGSPGMAYKVRKFIKRNRTAVTAGALVAIAILLGLALSTIGFVQASRDRDRARQAKVDAEKRRAEAETITELLQDILASADPFLLKGADYTLRQLLDDFTKEIGKRLADQPSAEAKLRSTIGKTYGSLGLYPSAEPHLRKALELRRGILGDEHPDVVNSLEDLAELLFQKDEYEAAESLFREGLAIRRQAFGDRHPDVALSLTKLAHFLKDSYGDKASAESLLREAVAIQRAVYGKEHRSVPGTMTDLGDLLREKKRFAEAESLLGEALAIRRKLFGGQHADVGKSLNALARLQWEKGNLDEAEALCREALAMFQKTVGVSREVGQTMNMLAELSRDKGNYDQAESLFREALAGTRKWLGADHPHVAWQLRNLAVVLSKKGNYPEAETLLREALEIQTTRLGDQHRDTLETAAALSALASQDPKTRRARRRRPKKRGGTYEVIKVENGGTIEGIAVYRGEVPAPRKIQIVKDHETCGHRRKIAPKIKVNNKQQVEDVVVFLGDIKGGKPIDPSAGKPTIDQRTCTFSPHVQVVVENRPVEIVNSDPVPHNAHVTQNMWTVINPMQPRQGMRSEFTFNEVGPAAIKCDIHNWMRAYVYVLWHPYYDVSGNDGSFRLADVPPGEYELVVWQEHLGERTTTVKVEAGKTTRVRFELTEN